MKASRIGSFLCLVSLVFPSASQAQWEFYDSKNIAVAFDLDVIKSTVRQKATNYVVDSLSFVTGLPPQDWDVRFDLTSFSPEVIDGEPTVYLELRPFASNKHTGEIHREASGSVVHYTWPIISDNCYFGDESRSCYFSGTADGRLKMHLGIPEDLKALDDSIEDIEDTIDIIGMLGDDLFEVMATPSVRFYSSDQLAQWSDAGYTPLASLDSDQFQGTVVWSALLSKPGSIFSLGYFLPWACVMPDPSCQFPEAEVGRLFGEWLPPDPAGWNTTYSPSQDHPSDGAILRERGFKIVMNDEVTRHFILSAILDEMPICQDYSVAGASLTPIQEPLFSFKNGRLQLGDWLMRFNYDNGTILEDIEAFINVFSSYEYEFDRRFEVGSEIELDIMFAGYNCISSSQIPLHLVDGFCGGRQWDIDCRPGDKYALGEALGEGTTKRAEDFLSSGGNSVISESGKTTLMNIAIPMELESYVPIAHKSKIIIDGYVDKLTQSLRSAGDFDADGLAQTRCTLGSPLADSAEPDGAPVVCGRPAEVAVTECPLDSDGSWNGVHCNGELCEGVSCSGLATESYLDSCQSDEECFSYHKGNRNWVCKPIPDSSQVQQNMCTIKCDQHSDCAAIGLDFIRGYCHEDGYCTSIGGTGSPPIQMVGIRRVEWECWGAGNSDQPAERCVTPGNVSLSTVTCDVAGILCEPDNCPWIPNDYADRDGDGKGDVCDVCPLDNPDDSDVDGLCDSDDNCPQDFNPDQEDMDGDGWGTPCDCDESPITGSYTHPGAEEICDDHDNDCDGQIDEGWGIGDPCGQGECDGGVEECVVEGLGAFQSTQCSTEEGGSDDKSGQELCGDNKDNDCDGEIDEGFEELGDTCGDGICEGGEKECSADMLDIVCSTEEGGSNDLRQAESCDLVDNDCDGSFDEDWPELGSWCGTDGPCFGGSFECNQDGTGSICDSYPGGSNDRSEPEVCDGVDNDCDGVVDDPNDDYDGDFRGRLCDNCPDDSNPDQNDKDDDGIGDVCDNSDTDDLMDDEDNCIACDNPDQSNIDGDLKGDVCDGDTDGDGVPDDGGEDPAISEAVTENIEEYEYCKTANPFFISGDYPCGGDIVVDCDDNCPEVPNPDQQDYDGDAQGDACDSDDDNDNVDDPADPDDNNEFVCGDSDGDGCDDCSVLGNQDVANDGSDHDGDGLCDQGDPDDDNDGIEDYADDCQYGVTDWAPSSTTDSDQDGCQDDVEDPCFGDNSTGDIDGDGLCSDQDDDDDNDGILDADDNCDRCPNPDQANMDESVVMPLIADDFGDACDIDMDGDGVIDASELVGHTNVQNYIQLLGNCKYRSSGQFVVTSAGYPTREEYGNNPCSSGHYEKDGGNCDDNCIAVANPSQGDCDRDGIGNFCEETEDVENPLPGSIRYLHPLRGDGDIVKHPCVEFFDPDIYCYKTARADERCGEFWRLKTKTWNFVDSLENPQLEKLTDCSCGSASCSACPPQGNDKDINGNTIYWRANYQHSPLVDGDIVGLAGIECDRSNGVDCDDRAVPVDVSFVRLWDWRSATGFSGPAEDGVSYPFRLKANGIIAGNDLGFPDTHNFRDIGPYLPLAGRHDDIWVSIDPPDYFFETNVDHDCLSAPCYPGRPWEEWGINVWDWEFETGYGLFKVIENDFGMYYDANRELDSFHFAVAGITDSAWTKWPEVYLFGGEGLDGRISDTLWHRPADGLWQRVSPQSGSWPSPRSGAAIAYDQAGNRLLMFGGRTNTFLTNEMWEYDLSSGQWTLISQADPPPPSAYSTYVTDGGSRWFVFGGLTEADLGSWLGEYDMNAGVWTVHTEYGPLDVRRGAYMAYDEVADRLLFFGGDSGPGGRFKVAHEGEVSLAELPLWEMAEGTGFEYVDDGFLITADDTSTSNGVAWHSYAPFLRTSDTIHLETRFQITDHNSRGDLNALSVFGVVAERAVSFMAYEYDGSKWLSPEFLAVYPAEGPPHPPVDMPAFEVDWTQPHDYTFDVDITSDSVLLKVDGEEALDLAYTFFPVQDWSEAGEGIPDHLGIAGIGTGGGIVEAVVAWDFFRWSWGGNAELLNDIWSVDLTSGTWTEIAPSCIGAGCPVPSAFGAAMYDSQADEMVLFGGIKPAGTEVAKIRRVDLATGSVVDAVDDVEIDSIAPVITVSGVSDGEHYPDDVTPVIDVTDDNLDSVTTTLDGLAFVSGTTVTTEQQHVLDVEAVDTMGSEASVLVVFTIDKTPPTLSVTGVADAQYYNAAVSPVITADDLNIDTFVTLLNGEAFVSGTPIDIDGHYVLYTEASDLAGWTTYQLVEFWIDSLAPDVFVSGVSDGEFYAETVAPTYSAMDENLLSVTAEVDGLPFESGDPIASEGEHVLEVTAIDAAANETVVTTAFTIDATPPTIQITGVVDGGTHAPGTAATIVVEEPHLDAGSVSIKLDGADYVSGTPIDTLGAHLLVVDAADLALNTSSESVAFTIEEPCPTGLSTWLPMDVQSYGLTPDASGSLRGVVHGGAVTVAGKVGSALEFDGIDDYIEVPDDAGLDFGANDFSVVFWSKKLAPSSSWDNCPGVQKWRNRGEAPGENEWAVSLCSGPTGDDNLPGFAIESGNDYFKAASPDPVTIGAWHFIAAVRAGTEMLFYLDGVLKDTETIGPSAVNNVGRDLFIGARDWSTMGYTNAVFDEIQIFNRALLASEVAAIFNSGSVGLCDKPGCADVDGDGYFSSGTGSGCGPLDCDDTNAGVNPGATEDCNNGIDDDCDTLIDGDDDTCNCPAGLVSYWKLDEGTGASTADVQGVNSGSISGATWTTGKVGNALDFDGSNDRVNLGNDQSLNFSSSQPFSITAWIRPDVIKNCFIVARSESATKKAGYQFVLRPDHKLAFAIINDNTTSPRDRFIVDGDSLNVVQNEWNHVVVTYDGSSSTSGVTFYVNGVAETAHVVIEDNLVGNGLTDAPTMIATREQLDLPFDGLIDEVAIFNRVLNAGEVQQQHANGIAGKGYCE